MATRKAKAGTDAVEQASSDPGAVAVENFCTGRELLPAKRGKPSPTTDDAKMAVSELICEAIESGEPIRAACAAQAVDHTTFLSWVAKGGIKAGGKEPAECFAYISQRYARAIQTRAELQFLELEQLAAEARGQDSAGVNAVKVMVDTRKWVLARMNPRRFGDNQQIEISGKDGAPMGLILSVAKTAIVDDEDDIVSEQ